MTRKPETTTDAVEIIHGLIFVGRPERLKARESRGGSHKVILIPALLLFLGGGLVTAQSSIEYKTCSDAARTQFALHKCADDEARRADRALDIAYKRLLSMQKGDPGVAQKVKALEAAWTTYRDAFIEAMYPAVDKQAAYGTMFAVEALLTRARLTRLHTGEIENKISRDP